MFQRIENDNFFFRTDYFINLSEIDDKFRLLFIPYVYIYIICVYVCIYVYMYSVEFKLLAWSWLAQSVCQRAFSLLEIWFQRPFWVRILHSGEEHNLSPFDSKIACLCHSIEINSNKYIYIYIYIYIYVYAVRQYMEPALLKILIMEPCH